MTQLISQMSSNKLQNNHNYKSEVNLQIQAQKKSTQIFSLSTFKVYCLVTLLTKIQSKFNWKTMNQQKQVKRNVGILNLMLLTLIKELSEITMKIGYQ